MALVCAALLTMGYQYTYSDVSARAACVCSTPNQHDASLPASHPQNRCADVSWTAWVSGRSQSNQMHFMDLLELLYGHAPAPEIAPTQPVEP